VKLFVLLVLMPTLVTLGCQSTGAGDKANMGRSAQSLPASIDKVTSVEGITEYRLENGLKVLLFPDQSKAKVTVNMTYLVGSRFEGYGEAGMAHLLEHMLFKGTPERPNIWELLQDRGAQFNGTTWTDRTNYYETLPASPENLRFALALEADRMVNSVIAEKDLQKEFSVVRNEFEMQENNPGSILLQRMHSTAFLWHNYGQSTIGNKSDIERVPVANLRRFYEKYYQPDNAILVVAGQFDKEQALQQIEEYFAPIPKPERTLQTPYTQEPVQDGERSVVLRRTGDVALAGVLYHIVPGSHEDFVAIEALSDILLREPGGIVYEKLVEGGWASGVYGGPFSWHDPGTFWSIAQISEGKSPEKTQQLLIEAIEGLDKKAITKQKVDRFRQKALSDFRLRMANSQSIAVGLSEWAAMGDWRLMFVHRDRIENLQVDEVQQVVDRYFVSSNRTQGLFLPQEQPQRAPQPKQPDVPALVEGYEGREVMAAGEAFEPTYANVAKRTQYSTLPMGAKAAFLAKQTRGETIEMSLSVHYGSAAKLVDLAQAEELLPSLMLRGTESLDFQALQDRMVELDAKISGTHVGPGQAQFRISTVRENFPAVIELMGQILREPALSAEEFEVLKNKQITSLQESLTDPRRLAQNALARISYPYDRSSIFYVPTLAEQLAQVKATDVSKLRTLYEQFWGAQDMSITVVGDFDRDVTEQKLSQVLAGWNAQQPFQKIVASHRDAAIDKVVIDTPDKKGAMVLVGHNLALNVTDERYPALWVGSFMVGGSPSSRIFDRLRQKEGLAYGAWGSIVPAFEGDFGRFVAGAICAPKNAGKAMSYLMEEITKFDNQGVTADELQQARKALLAQIRNRLADDRYLVGFIDRTLDTGRSIGFYDDLVAKLRKVDVAEVNRIVAETLQSDAMARVTAADLSQSQAASH
jgi:zinc protease